MVPRLARARGKTVLPLRVLIGDEAVADAGFR
jgi:hypothetical protein